MIEINELKPEKVFRYFSEISKIPHGSTNTDAIAQYCLDFAAKRNLKATKDNGGNVVIYKNASNGCESSEPIILQGHLDMVCVSAPDKNIDMDKEPITLCTDGEYVWADGTSLGGDDGIALAYILAILDSNDIYHPPIEALFTSDEEIGMIGAGNFDASLVRGKRLINIDSEDEGILTVSCAGGILASCTLPLTFVKTDSDMISYNIEITGLLGGHSGVEIDKHRINASVMLGNLLHQISRFSKVYISSVTGGNKDNVIPSTSSAVICVNNGESEKVLSSVEEFSKLVCEEYSSVEPNLTINIEKCSLPEKCTDEKSSKTLIFVLSQIPNGIQEMSADISGLVKTSLNMGILKTTENGIKMGFLVRANSNAGKQLLVQRLQAFMEFVGGNVELSSDYSPWEYRQNSPLRDTMVKTFEELYGKTPEINAIHAGLECGMLSDKIPDSDMVSMGPDLENVHTAKERMNVASVERTWNYLLKILENLK